MATIVLKRTGAKMPQIGFGLWKVRIQRLIDVSGLTGMLPVTKTTCADTVYNALKEGYRLLDGAVITVTKRSREGLARAIKDGIVKREDVFVTSKLWNTFHAHDHAKAIAKKQLELWELTTLTFSSFTSPFRSSMSIPPTATRPSDNVPLQETWTAMEELVDEGLAKNIGLSNCQGSLILDVLRYARIEPQVLQVELHPYLSQEALVKFCKVHGIAITAYSSFGPQSYVELDGHKNAKSLLEHDVVSTIAKKNQKTTAQVLLRWALQQGIAVIPKSNNHHRLVQNLASADFTLTDADMQAISGLNINLRLNDPVDLDPRMGIFA
ncbi:putative NAD(P)H-dependent D-xylose reductase xyl1 [Grifola frondosa]|uniref:Putative NAD(P)H-dependent D-xylose reductase xyl1 n=1 Tax=Grifola frondosa TaxID=5627 RepID=A0A1C7MSX1_GRIFR|nr:putative NAD(P)H-dependent D-xylose reductase xyl1 [Grifola frondosa]